MNFTLRKEEHLCRSKDIEALILKGNSSFIYPFKVFWLCLANHDPKVKVAFSVSKKRFKRANKRNLIKRRMREAYRINKSSLTESLNAKNTGLNLLLVYVSSDVIKFIEIEKKIVNVLHVVLEEIQKGTQ